LIWSIVINKENNTTKFKTFQLCLLFRSKINASKKEEKTHIDDYPSEIFERPKKDNTIL
tara:strand:+ start:713 stop:889 length:177 start_codon:yes stop_codon:yes gene_type:complete